MATLQHDDKIKKRSAELKAWTKELAEGLQKLGARTFPTDTYFFLADFAHRNAVTMVLLPVGIPLGLAGLGAFIWALKPGWRR